MRTRRLQPRELSCGMSRGITFDHSSTATVSSAAMTGGTMLPPVSSSWLPREEATAADVTATSSSTCCCSRCLFDATRKEKPRIIHYQVSCLIVSSRLYTRCRCSQRVAITPAQIGHIRRVCTYPVPGYILCVFTSVAHPHSGGLLHYDVAKFRINMAGAALLLLPYGDEPNQSHLTAQ